MAIRIYSSIQIDDKIFIDLPVADFPPPDKADTIHLAAASIFVLELHELIPITFTLELA